MRDSRYTQSVSIDGSGIDSSPGEQSEIRLLEVVRGRWKKKFREWPKRVGADRVHRWRYQNEHLLLA